MTEIREGMVVELLLKWTGVYIFGAGSFLYSRSDPKAIIKKSLPKY